MKSEDDLTLNQKRLQNYIAQVISKDGCDPSIHKVTSGHSISFSDSSL
jgi:hypothetical protein